MFYEKLIKNHGDIGTPIQMIQMKNHEKWPKLMKYRDPNCLQPHPNHPNYKPNSY